MRAVTGFPHLKPTTSARRQIVMAVLLGLAVVGAAMRYWAPNPSMLRDVGTLLLVLWLPAVGNLVGYVIHKLPRRKRDFAPGSSFIPHLGAELTPLPGAPAGWWCGQRAPADAGRCTVVVGSEGFTARGRPAGDAIELEFLRPQLALAKLTPGTEFHLLVGATAVARGRVASTAFT